MSDTGNIPSAMMEAAKSAGRQAALARYRAVTGIEGTGGPAYVRDYADAAVDAALAAAFAECEVRTEYATQIPGEASVRGITIIRLFAQHMVEQFRAEFPGACLVTRTRLNHQPQWLPAEDVAVVVTPAQEETAE